ncbi:MAG: MATE family efflux transporter [Magnetococcales bacterium]|nr:MATE family efflux transporter [Magnetococcales bacterium]
MSRRNLTHGEVLHRLAQLSLPMAWGVFMVLSFYLVDTFFIGLLGTRELAAISFTFPVVSATASIAMGLGVGALSVISRTIGRGDHVGGRRYATHSLMLALLVVGLFVVLGLATIDPLFRALGAGEELLPMIRQYMELWYAGMIFLVVPMVGNSIIRASGDARFPSLIMTIAAVSNLILDPLLIFGLAGFPRLELQGAAWASLVSRAITLLASLYVLHFRLKLIDFSFPAWSSLFQSWKKILHIGLPAAATNMIAPVLTGLLTTIVAQYGSSAVAAFGVASRIEMFFLVPFVALSAGLGPFMGQNFGAKKFSRLREAIRLGTLFSLLWGGLITVLCWFAAEWIVQTINKESEVVVYGVLYLTLVPMSYGAIGVIYAASASFNALGSPLSASLLALTRTFFLTVPLAWLGHTFWGLPAVFGAISLANLLVGGVAFFWIRHQTGPKLSGQITP